MKEAIAVHYRGACSECHQVRERRRIPCHNALRSPLSALKELTETPTLREALCCPETERRAGKAVG
jgi:hypothetical protein